MLPRDISLIWVPEGLEPTPGAFNSGRAGPVNLRQTKFDTIRAAVEQAISLMDREYRESRSLPWIKSGTGKGSAIFNREGILALDQAQQAGANG